MSKSNVHPDHYKVAGRDRQDDAAAARQARAIAAKPPSRERPDRMSKGPYFQRPEPAADASSARRTATTKKKSSTSRAMPKASSGRRPGRTPKPKPGAQRSGSKKKK